MPLGEPDQRRLKLLSMHFRTLSTLRIIPWTIGVLTLRRFFKSISSASSSSRLSVDPPRVCESLVPSTGDEEDSWAVPDARQRFWKSIAPKKDIEQSIRSIVPVENLPREGSKLCHFSMEALLQFKNDHAEHVAHQTVPKPAPKRPSYDNRKRQFCAVQPMDRKK